MLVGDFVDSADVNAVSVDSDLAVGTESAVFAVVFAVPGMALAVSVSVGGAVGRTHNARNTFAVSHDESSFADTLVEAVVVTVVIADDGSVFGDADVVLVFVARIADTFAVNPSTVVGTFVLRSWSAVSIVASDVGRNALAQVAIEDFIFLGASISRALTIEEGNLVDELGWSEDLAAGLRLNT